MTRREFRVAAVAVLAALVISAHPAAAATTTVEDFEDGDITVSTSGWDGWNGDTANFSASSNGFMGGSYEGNLTGGGATNNYGGPAVTFQNTGAEPHVEWVNYTARVYNDNYRWADYIVTDPSGTHMAQLTFESDGNIDVRSGGNTDNAVFNFQPHTNYDISVRLHRTTQEISFYINGSKISTIDSYVPTDMGGFKLQLNTDNGVTATAYVDDIEISTYSNAAPNLDESSIEPDDGTLASGTDKLKIDVSDADFQYKYNESLDVNFYIDNNFWRETQMTGNGTASVPIKKTGGSHDWYVAMSDDPRGALSSSTFSYKYPETLYIRNETHPSELVNNTEVTVRFYPEGTGDVYVRNTTNGKVDMAGLPADQWFIATASAGGWFDRRVAISSLLEQQDIYLVNDSATVVEPIFDYQDFTGRFPPDETIVRIQTPINGSWQTVEGDVVGATGEIPAHLRYNVRHRVNVTNVVTGESTTVGPYIPTTSGVKDLRIHSLDEVEITSPVSVAFEPDVGSVRARNRSFRARFHSEDDELASYNLTVRLENQSGTYVLGTQSGSAAGGETLEVPVNLSDEAESTVNVSANYTTTGGGQATVDRGYTVTEYWANDHSLLNILSTKIPGRTTNGFLTLFAGLSSVLLTAAIGSKLRMSTEGYGLVLTGFVAGWVIVGWLGIAALFAAGATWTVAAALKAGI